MLLFREMPPELTVAELVEGVRARDRATLGRAITLVESNHRDHRRLAQQLLRALPRPTAPARRVGISGVPGAGKSTFIEGLGCRLVARGHHVAVLAVDPSSSLSRGSILGDKTRMERLSNLEAAFIRPSPAGGSLGGVTRKTRETIAVCEAAGFDVLLVETVGVGQSETLVAEMVDLFLVLMVAGTGDELQGIKRGILELADILAVNKADGENRRRAAAARVELERALAILRPAGRQLWDPRVVTCSALEGDGLDEIWELVEEHHRKLGESGELDELRRRQLVRWLWSMVDDELRRAVREHPVVRSAAGPLEDAVKSGQLSAPEAATEILRSFGIG